LKLLVTGGAGFIGSAFIRKSLIRGYKIINIDSLTYASCIENLASVKDHSNYSFINLDIRDRCKVAETVTAIEPDAIIHLAAETHVDRSIDSPINFVETNILGTFNLLEAARLYWIKRKNPSNFKFLHVSTDEVFGSLGPDGFFTEDSKYSPRSPYSASKASSDHLVRAWGETFNLPVLITNCSNNYGPFQFPEKLLPLAIMNAINGKDIPIYGDGKNIRDWLHVSDHVNALILVLEEGRLGSTYNIGGNNEHENIEIIKKLCDILDKELPKEVSYSNQIKFVADRPGHDQRYAIDSAKISNELGWMPHVSIDEGLKETILWYLDNKKWLKDLESRDGVGKRLGSNS
tara:strand:+ start:591 stop:1631 length:1041 start_codon:yes stop_codon:yes gene_type:complete